MTEQNQLVRISDVFDLQMGKTPPRKHAEYWSDGTIDWVSIKDLSSYHKYVAATREKISSRAVTECKMKPIPANTLLMSFKLSIGKTAITVKPTYTNEAIMGFIDKGTYAFDLNYLYHQFKSKQWQQETNIAVMGATLNKKSLSEQMIVLPPLHTQKQIARQLDQIEVNLITAQQMLETYDELIQSRFVEMFEHNNHSYDYVPLNSIGDVQTGATPSRKHTEYYNGSIPWIKTGEVRYSKITSTEESITKEAVDNSNCKVLPAGTVIIAMYGQGDTRGKAAITGIPATTNQACAAIVLDHTRCNGIFLLQQLKLQYKELRALSVGATQKNLNLTIVKQFPVMVPPIDLQNEFASFVEKVEEQKNILQQTIEELQTLYDSLAQQYFAV